MSDVIKRRIEFDKEEGIAFWVCISDEEAAIKNFPNLFAERADAESAPAPDATRTPEHPQRMIEEGKIR